MKKYINLAKRKYESYNTRERVLVAILCWAILYAFFYFITFKQMDRESILLNAQIKALDDQIVSWENQIRALQKLTESPLYAKWLAQRKALQTLQGQYKYLLQASPSKQWQDVVRAIIQVQSNIKLEKIQNLPETPYTLDANTQAMTNLYKQQLLVEVYSDYFNFLNYLQRLETVLPNIHWEGLNYEVTQYPLAKINMEFSIIYEKNHENAKKS